MEIYYLPVFAVVLLAALYAGYIPTNLSGYFEFSIARTLLAASPIAIAIIILLLDKKERSGGEPYGNFHRTLNEVHGHEVITEWLNMGYWTDGCAFAEACEALALKLVLAACPQSGHVLDVGFGSGDSLLLQLQHPLIPRPKSLTGITSMASQYRRASERVNQINHEHPLSVMLYHGDAIWRPSAGITTPHPFNPASNSPFGQFDSILALDCAYHFSTRKLFLEQCFARLRPGVGRVALADMCFEPSGTSFGLHAARLWANALSVPSANLVTLSQYRCQLESIGYHNIRVEDISDHVFPGFTAFLSARGLLWAAFGYMLRIWWKMGGRYVLVTASKPKEDGKSLPSRN